MLELHARVSYKAQMPKKARVYSPTATVLTTEGFKRSSVRIPSQLQNFVAYPHGLQSSLRSPSVQRHGGELGAGQMCGFEASIAVSTVVGEGRSSREGLTEIKTQDSASDGQLSLIAAGTWGVVFAVVCSVLEGLVTLCLRAAGLGRGLAEKLPLALNWHLRISQHTRCSR
jgi:hypothetical protein